MLCISECFQLWHFVNLDPRKLPSFLRICPAWHSQKKWYSLVFPNFRNYHYQIFPYHNFIQLYFNLLNYPSSKVKAGIIRNSKLWFPYLWLLYNSRVGCIKPEWIGLIHPTQNIKKALHPVELLNRDTKMFQRYNTTLKFLLI